MSKILIDKQVLEYTLLALRIDDLALVRESVVALRAALEQPPRQSLGDDEIRAGLHEAIEHATQYERAAFIKGVKFAERAHSVGGEE